MQTTTTTQVVVVGDGGGATGMADVSNMHAGAGLVLPALATAGSQPRDSIAQAAPRSPQTATGSFQARTARARADEARECGAGACTCTGVLTGDSTMMLGIVLPLPPDGGRWRNRWRRCSIGDRVRAVGSSGGALGSVGTGVRDRGSSSTSPRGEGVTISRGR